MAAPAIQMIAVVRQLLLKQPIMLQKSGQMETLGGKQQCTPAILRSALARLHNWVILVREVLRAELPEFETFSSLSTILRLDNEPSALEFKDATARMAAVLDLQVEPCLNYRANPCQAKTRQEAIIADPRPNKAVSSRMLGKGCQGLKWVSFPACHCRILDGMLAVFF